MGKIRYIQAKLDKQIFLFESQLISNILLVEQRQILSLPFYSKEVLGVVPYSGEIVTLVSLRQIVGIVGGILGESLTVIRLSEGVKELAGLGIVVDGILGNIIEPTASPEIMKNATDPTSSIRLFGKEILGNKWKQPLRWHKSIA